MQNMKMVGGARGFTGGFQAGGFHAEAQHDPNSPFGSAGQQETGDIIDGEVVNKRSSSQATKNPKCLE